MTIDDPHTTRRPTDAFTGALLTLACGDALGAPAEFTRQPAMRQKFGELRDMFGGGSCGWAPGEDGKLVPIDDEYGHPPLGGVLVQPWSVNSYTVDHEYKGGSIGLLSTAEDYWRFAQAMLNGGELNGQRILGLRSVDYMRRNHLTDEQREAFFLPGLGFGLGFGLVEDPATSGTMAGEGSFMWGGAAATTFWIDPVDEPVGLKERLFK